MLVDFTTGSCKAPGADPYDGLQCIGWSVAEGGRATVRLVNFPETCMAEGQPEWEGSAALLPGNHLDLAVTNPTDILNACGLCTYDWTFVVEGLSCGSDLSVHVLTRGCATCSGGSWVATLPLVDEPEGMLCNHLIPVPVSAMSPGWSNMPCCTGSDMTGCTSETTPCAGDLACREVPPAGALCMEQCAVREDCTLADVMDCAGGTCTLDRTW